MTRSARRPPAVDATLLAALGRGAVGLSASVVDLVRQPARRRLRQRRATGRAGGTDSADDWASAPGEPRRGLPG